MHSCQESPGGAPRRRSCGQALVELALLLPLLIVLIFAIIDFGYYLFVTISVNHATREGVRHAAMNVGVDCDSIKAKVVESAVGVVLTRAEVTVKTDPHGVFPDGSFPDGSPAVEVSVVHDHHFFVPSLWQFGETLAVKSTFKSIVTTFTGREGLTFGPTGGGTCPP